MVRRYSSTNSPVLTPAGRPSARATAATSAPCRANWSCSRPRTSVNALRTLVASIHAASSPAASVDLLSTVDAGALEAAWVLATQVRNALTLVRGRQQDQLPRQGAEVTAVAQALGRPASVTTGEFVDEYLRTMRRARQVVERTFDAG